MNKISSLILSSSVLWAIQSVIAADDAVVIDPQIQALPIGKVVFLRLGFSVSYLSVS